MIKITPNRCQNNLQFYDNGLYKLYNLLFLKGPIQRLIYCIALVTIMLHNFCVILFQHIDQVVSSMIKQIIIASILTAGSASAYAGEHLWDFKNLGINNTGNGYEHTISSGQGINLTISAWSSTGNGCASVTGNSGVNDVDSCIESAKLKSWGGGLGVQNRQEGNDTPNHAIDNTNDGNNNHDLDFDMVLLSFDQAVKITDFGTGWEWRDYDASVVAYTGATDFTGFDSHSNWSDILHKGWGLVDEISDNQTSGTQYARDFSVDDKDIHSKHWLVGTFNSAFSSTNWTDNNDAFKFSDLRVVSKPNGTDNNGGTEVNAPAMASVMFSLFALMMYRRKK